MPRSFDFIIKKISILYLVMTHFFYNETYASNSLEKEQLDVPKTCFMNLGNLSCLPKELIEEIFSHYPQQIHHLNRSSFTIMTGYNSEELSKGIVSPPRYRTYPFISTKRINFKELPFSIEDIPSYLWFKKVVSVEHIPKRYWPHIKGTKINFVRIFYGNLEASGMKEFAKVFQGSCVHIINFAGNKLGDEGTQYLSTMTNLTQMNLRNNNIGSAGVEFLSTMTNLTQMNLRNNNIGNAGVEFLSTMTNLTRLDVSDNKIGASGVKSLSTMTNLTKLGLSFNDIGDAGIKFLSIMTNLMQLNLEGHNISEVGLQSLSTMTNLIKLNLSLNNLGNIEGLQFLSTMTNLTQMDLSVNNIGNVGVQSLSKMTNLTQIDLSGNSLNNESIKPLSKMTSLSKLNLSDNNIDTVAQQSLKVALLNCRIIF